MSNNNLIHSSKLPSGVLNEQIREKAYESFTRGEDDFMDIITKLMRQTFGPGYSLVNREFTAICVQVLTDKQTQKLMSAGSAEISYKKVAKTTSKTIPKACRVYIPEIHTDRALPKSILSPSKKDISIMESMFPVFLSQTEELSKKPLFVGDRLTVKIKNELGGGIYINRIESSFSINPINASGGKDASAAFRCNIIKNTKVLAANPTNIAGNVTITDEGESGTKSELSAAAMSQQYIKYLYEKERDNIAELKVFWTKDKLKYFIKNSMPTTHIDQNLRSNYRELTWVLLYQISGFVPSGLSAGGNTVISAKAITDHYGVFRITKKRFDISKQELVEKYPDEKLFNDLEHSDLLLPDVAIKFFIYDFHNYFENKSQKKLEMAATAISGNETNKRLIVNYFTNNDKRMNMIFASAVTKVVDDFKTGAAAFVNAPPTFSEYPSFEDWMTLSMTGIAPGAKETSMISQAEPNSQELPVNKPPSTPDECHSNYPPYTDYAIHVNAQKKMVRKFFESKVSGQPLDFLNSFHKGVNSIKFAELEINCPFKVVRYDGDSGFPKDEKRWFDQKTMNKHDFLIFKERWGLGYYRARKQITHAVIQSLGNNLDENNYLKNTIHTMVSFGKKIPHFIVMQNGQIIQLVDAACALSYNTPVKLASINVAFGFGPGKVYPIESTDPTVSKPNHVLIKKDNIYSCHKLGTKAALESMQKLIKFLTTKTKIKYNLAAFDGKMETNEYNKSTIQSLGQFTGSTSGMNFIYYAWTYNFAFDNGGKNVLRGDIHG